MADLEARITQNSDNGSKPPRSDMGRKRGGQPGHAGKTREQVPPEEVDEVEDADPEACERFEILAKHPDTTQKARRTVNGLLRQWGRLSTYRSGRTGFHRLS